MLLNWIGWIGTFAIVFGLWGVGSKRRNAFLFTMVGESCYLLRSFFYHDWALFAVCWVFCLMAVRGWILWGKTT